MTSEVLSLFATGFDGRQSHLQQRVTMHVAPISLPQHIQEMFDEED